MNKLKEIWQVPRYKSLIKLGLWLLGFVILLFAISIPEENKVKEPLQYDEMKQALLEGNYKYYYLVFEDGIKRIYTGVIEEDNNIGIYESNTEMFRYSCGIENCEKILLDQKENYLISFPVLTMPVNIFDLINNVKPKESEKDGIKKYEYSLVKDDNNYNVIIKTDDYEILTIDITNNDNSYNLQFIKKD